MPSRCDGPHYPARWDNLLAIPSVRNMVKKRRKDSGREVTCHVPVTAVEADKRRPFLRNVLKGKGHPFVLSPSLANSVGHKSSLALQHLHRLTSEVIGGILK